MREACRQCILPGVRACVRAAACEKNHAGTRWQGCPALRAPRRPRRLVVLHNVILRESPTRAPPPPTTDTHVARPAPALLHRQAAIALRVRVELPTVGAHARAGAALHDYLPSRGPADSRTEDSIMYSSVAAVHTGRARVPGCPRHAKDHDHGGDQRRGRADAPSTTHHTGIPWWLIKNPPQSSGPGVLSRAEREDESGAGPRRRTLSL